MKTIHTLLMATCFVSCLSTTIAQAQIATAKLPETIATETPIADAETKAGTTVAAYSKASVMVNKAGYKAVKNFLREFKDGDDVKWCNEADVISATFNRNNIQNYVMYNKRGSLLRTMQVYNQTNIPNEIRTAIRHSEYAFYKIVLTQKILERGLLFYVIHIESPTEYKQILFTDNQFIQHSGYIK